MKHEIKPWKRNTLLKQVQNSVLWNAEIDTLVVISLAMTKAATIDRI